MNLRILYYIILNLSYIPHLFSYQLVTIKSISNSQKTFILDLGKKDQVYMHQQASFSTKYISFLAKVVEVSREFSQWKIIEKYAKIPVIPGDNIVMHMATNPSNPNIEYKRLGVPTTEQRNQAVGVKMYIGEGLNQSISKTNSQEIFSRNTKDFQLQYYLKTFKRLFFSIGYRYENQTTYAPNYIAQTTRNIALLELLLKIRPLDFETSFSDNFYFQIGSTLGLGLSKTQISGVNQSGRVIIFPTINSGLSYYFYDQFALTFDSSFESITAKETLSDTSTQNISEINFIVGVGFIIHF